MLNVVDRVKKMNSACFLWSSTTFEKIQVVVAKPHPVNDPRDVTICDTKFPRALSDVI